MAVLTPYLMSRRFGSIRVRRHAPCRSVFPHLVFRYSWARADDYVLFIDADETLRMPEGFRWPRLAGDGYRFQCELGGWQYQRNALVRGRQPWHWEGVLHEYLTQDPPHAWQHLAGPTIVVSRDGARARDPRR